MVIGPRLGVAGSSWCGGQTGLGLGRVTGNVYPLLRLGKVVVSVVAGRLGIPLGLSSSIGGAVGYIG